MAKSHENNHMNITVDNEFWQTLIPRMINLLNENKVVEVGQNKVKDILGIYDKNELINLGNCLNQMIQKNTSADEKNKCAQLLNITIETIKSKVESQNKERKQAHAGGIFHQQISTKNTISSEAPVSVKNEKSADATDTNEAAPPKPKN